MSRGRAAIKREILQEFPMPKVNDKPEQPKLLPGTDNRNTNLTTIKVVTHVDPVIKSIVKPTVTEMVPDHVKYFPDIDHVLTNPKPKIIIRM